MESRADCQLCREEVAIRQSQSVQERKLKTPTNTSTVKGVSSPVGTRGHATTVNNEIVMNLFMNLFLVT